MNHIDTKTIEEAVYNLCIQANTSYSEILYEIIYDKFIKSKDKSEKQKLFNILKNSEIAYNTKRPLCQDTGQVIVFLKIGQNCKICGENINVAINNAISRAYTENKYRMSIVKNAIFDRTNTKQNTPAIIYTDIVDGNSINIQMLIKGAGSENYSNFKALTPTSTKEEIFAFIRDTINNAGEKSCPPYIIGIGAGGTFESAGILSKQAFFNKNNSTDEIEFLEDLKNYLGKLNTNILDLKIITTSTHIASMPIAVTINCHSTRHAECTIKNEQITYTHTSPNFRDIKNENNELKEIKTNEITKIKQLSPGESFLLTGEIYTARDAAHKRLFEDYAKNKTLPIDLKEKFIFYAGPCPATKNEIIGPIGPTTSIRMDSFLEFVHSQGLLGTIGKGERTQNANNMIKKFNGKYFSTQGGIACLLSSCVKYTETIAYEELGTEAIRKLYVEKLPLTVEI